ncbi:MAG: DNA alkylation repair protein [bacterium]|jgi:3-methyladenine DNA glycosylase AlkD
MGTFKEITKDLKTKATKEKAAILSRFFKTGKGEYGEGDKFYGIIVPEQRKIAKAHCSTTTKETIIALLDSAYHEERLTGLYILNQKFTEALKQDEAKQWVDLYLKKADRVNNWDLVDSTAHIILGQWLDDKDRSILYILAKDRLLWKNRIAVVATLHFIRKNDLKDILKISEIMIDHKHDLIHKATGWMLREAWKKDANIVEEFLNKHAHNMPRTMLRYAIEKIPEIKRKAYLDK